MDKRVILFMVLSLAIVLGYDFALKELGLLPPPPDSTAPAPTAGSAPSSSVSGSETESSRISPDQPASQAGGEKNVPPPGAETAAEETVEVDTTLYRAKFTARGAALTSWELKRYPASSGERSGVELVRQGGKFAGPLAISTDNADLTKELAQGIYVVKKDFITLDKAHPTGHVTFVYENSVSGVRLEKELTFHADSYVVDIAITQTGLGGSVQIGLGTNFGIVEWGEGFIGAIGPATSVDGKIELDLPDSETEYKGSVQWAALQDKYFISVLIPKDRATVLVKKEGEKLASTTARIALGSADTTVGLQLYAGPKEYDTLQNLGVGLEGTIDFGWFIFGSWSWVKAVAKPIFYVLRFINEYTNNYGASIILLTIGIKLLFIPLQYKSYKSMKDMQEIQPKAAALQEKLKDDRDRLNKELIKLYRDHKVNPVGGCLPMLLQMPVFVALFNILNVAIDLRQAPLGLWITDLSVQDPYYVLPIVMGLTMVIQQKITPTTMDPTQAKVMLLLPVFMTFLFINFPAGLVLYWLTNNTLTIGQQLVTDRFFFPKRLLAPAGGEEAGKK
jgi:YidC/Oxa1 family membrane protein insertase